VLARAFLSRAPILILDEPTSALDYESEAAIQQSVEHLVKLRGLTVIVIAHRMSTIRSADFVIHLRDGEILRTGDAKYVFGKIADTDVLFGADQRTDVAQ
jgi:ABC-type multidrug transport system fused ATPase/permease subunit